MNKERMLFALGEIDEKYIKEAEPKPMMSTKRIITLAVSLTLVVALSLYLFIPFADPESKLKDHENSSYYPLLATIDSYYMAKNKSPYKNYFDYYAEGIGDLLAGGLKGGVAEDAAPGNGSNNMMGAEMDSSTGEYVESTDNQVDGVIESDLMKMTSKYIFRLGYRNENKDDEKYGSVITVLRVYSIDKESSTLVAQIDVPTLDDEDYTHYTNQEMFLSTDADTITILKPYRSNETSKNRIGVVALDVSDVMNITERAKVSVDGSINTTRLVNGRLVVISDHSFNTNQMDYGRPETFVPTVNGGDGNRPIEYEDIIYPEKISDTKYTVVTMMDSENLEIFGTKALLNFTSDVYISKNNIYLSREYTEKIENETSRKSDIAVLDYTGEELTDRGIITARGWTEDQYSFDEKDGYLRLVTSTNDTMERVDEGNVGLMTKQSASLYIYRLSDNALAYKVEDFAPQGETATAVRFDGDACYVCTAVVVTFTDPVFFFDLSDYENITYTDTGIIEGYSEHLINYGEGMLLGIGADNWQYSKVEIYKELGGEVVSAYKYSFNGMYSVQYKSYLVNRENNLFGFGIDYLYEYDEKTQVGHSYNCYVLISFDDTEMTVQKFKIDDLQATYTRAAFIDGYLYITTATELFVEKIN